MKEAYKRDKDNYFKTNSPSHPPETNGEQPESDIGNSTATSTTDNNSILEEPVRTTEDTHTNNDASKNLRRNPPRNRLKTSANQK